MNKKLITLFSALLIGGLTLTGCSSSKSTTKTYSKDDWSLEYDSTYISVNEDKDYGDVTFNFYNEETETAGSNYVAIQTIKDTDYQSVLNDAMKDNSDTKGEMNKNGFGKDAVDAYIYIPTNEENEDSDLKITTTYTAIPDGKNVILIESFRTLGTDDEVEATVDSTFEELLDTFEVK